jgi:hypothetical protein
LGGGTLADRIVCKRISRTWDDSGCPHDHIDAVGIGDSSGCSYKWSVAQVRHLLRSGYRFYVVDVVTGRHVEVSKLDCRCGARTLRVRMNGFRDDELEDLPECDDPNGRLHPLPSDDSGVAVESRGRGRRTWPDGCQ